MLLMIDNYDSFTYNLVQYFGELGADVQIHRNDKINLDEIEAMQPEYIVISPGPCTPLEAGISNDVIRACAGKMPILGVCLGHQSIGHAYGAEIVRAGRLMHGKTDQIYHDDKGLFAGLDNPFVATRYHSLLIRPDTLSADFDVCAWVDEPDGTRAIMAIRHREWPLFGWQFHPESFLCDAGIALLENFLHLPATAPTTIS